jgi:hypothetical protein
MPSPVEPMLSQKVVKGHKWLLFIPKSAPLLHLYIFLIPFLGFFPLLVDKFNFPFRSMTWFSLVSFLTDSQLKFFRFSFKDEHISGFWSKLLGVFFLLIEITTDHSSPLLIQVTTMSLKHNSQRQPILG